MDRYKQNIETGIKEALKQFPDAEAVFNKVFKTMKQKANGRCKCGLPIDNYYTRIPNQFKFQCRGCRRVISPLSVTPLRRSHKDIVETIDIACRSYVRRKILPPTEIAALYNYKYKTAKTKNTRIAEWMRMAIGNAGQDEESLSINNKVCRKFSGSFSDLNSAVSGLFGALPSLTEAMKDKV